MDLVSKLTDYVNNNFESITSMVGENSWIINLKGMEDLECSIKNLITLNEKITELSYTISNTILQAQRIHQIEIDKIDIFLNKLKKPPGNEIKYPELELKPVTSNNSLAENDNTWTKVITKRRNVEFKKEIPIKQQAISVHNNTNSTNRAKVHFTNALFLQAIKVPTFDQVESNGELYYIESADHFAFKLAGILFHGNIGVIYTDEKNPEKIKNCKFRKECIKKERCDYYHDPLKFPGSKDKRNFIASSWLYAPPNSQFKNKSKSRRFGSFDHLDLDIMNLQEEETDRFSDQTMHDVLCSVLLRKYLDSSSVMKS